MRLEDIDEKNFEDLFALICQMVQESVFAWATPSRARIYELFKNPACKGFLAYSGTTPSGFVGAHVGRFFWSEHTRASDLGIYVCPQFRGGRAALMLLRAIESWAFSMNQTHFFMGHSVGGKIEQMKDFYRRQGYKIGGFNAMKEL